MATETKPPAKRPATRDYLESLIIAVILALFVRTWIFQAFTIPSGSMEPNLLVNDHVIVNKMEFAPVLARWEQAILPIRDVHRGDIIVFKHPEEPDRDLIKRVVGLPGDRVELHRKQVYINGQPLSEPYAHYAEPPTLEGPPKTDDVREEYGPVTVPPGQYFMMGDNRDNSRDSRYWGFMPASYIKGRALFIYYSYDEGSSWSIVTGTRWARLGHIVR